MRKFACFLLTGAVCPALGFAQSACSPKALPQAAKTVAALRHQLHGEAVSENDATVPASIAAELAQLKTALNQAAVAAFACADQAAPPEAIEKTLADALDANLSEATQSTVVTRNRKDLGAYGSELAVQVFPLFSSPRYVEVNFRYGVECGDDNLLLVFADDAPKTSAGASAWREVLTWGAPRYSTVGDAFGDFVLLTPLSGYAGARNWRFVVAHGQPGCGGVDSPSHFDVDLLQPSADPAQPRVLWHLERPYIRSEVPRLSTTEDTLDFQITAPGEGANTRPHTEAYRFRVTLDNRVQQLKAPPDPAGTGDKSAASTNSPR